MMALRQANSAGSTTTTRNRVTSSPRKRKSVLTCWEVLLFVPPLFPPLLLHPKATTCGWLKWATEKSGLLSIGKQNWIAQMRNNSLQLSSSKMICYKKNRYIVSFYLIHLKFEISNTIILNFWNILFLLIRVSLLGAVRLSWEIKIEFSLTWSRKGSPAKEGKLLAHLTAINSSRAAVS